MELLDVQPGDRVLEIGGGHGVAATLIADQLETGHVLGVDRSAKMVEAATRRNRAHVDAGRARFVTSSVERWDAAGAEFDKALAINVRLFGDPGHPGIAAVRDSLVPDGRLCLVFQPPSAAGVGTLLASFTRALEANGFGIERAEVREIAPVPAAGVLARRA